MYIVRRDPNKGYMDSNLWIPKNAVNVEALKRALTFELQGRGNQQTTLQLWQETAAHLLVPLRFWRYSERLFEIVDCRPTNFQPIDIRSRIKLDHRMEGGQLIPTGHTIQQQALDALLEAQGGLLQLSCGAGKSVIALELIARLAVPTIIILDNTTLMGQWVDEINRHLTVEGGVGLIEGGSFDWQHPIVLATFQTLVKRAHLLPERFRRWFGTTIWDECFPAGTVVDRTPIEQLKPGDTVWNFDPVDRQCCPGVITKTFSKPAQVLLRVTLQNGNSIVVTPGHPFFCRWPHFYFCGLACGYVEACALTLEHEVAFREPGAPFDELSFSSVQRLDDIQPTADGTFGGACPDGQVYNIEVEPWANYFANNMLVHNSHHVGAPTFARTADMFYGRRYGLTATPHRADGMHVIYDMHIGPVVFKDLTQDLCPTVRFEWTGFSLDLNDPRVMQATHSSTGELHMGMLARYFGGYRPRLDYIINRVRQLRDDGRKTLVLSSSIDELVNLLSLWNGRTHLYSEIPLPTAQELDPKSDPTEWSWKDRLVRPNWTVTHEEDAIYNRLVTATNLSDNDRNRLKMFQHLKDVEREMQARQKRYLHELLEVSLSSDAGLMIYDVSRDERRHAIDNKPVTFSIMKYGREGLDSRALDTVLVLEPQGQKEWVQQVMGRALRLYRGKQRPLIIFLEDNVGVLIGLCNKLRHHLRKWPVEEGGPYRFEMTGNRPNRGWR